MVEAGKEGILIEDQDKLVCIRPMLRQQKDERIAMLPALTGSKEMIWIYSVENSRDTANVTICFHLSFANVEPGAYLTLDVLDVDGEASVWEFYVNPKQRQSTKTLRVPE